jgi:hypothetical protein
LKTTFGAPFAGDCNLTLESTDSAHHQDPIQTPCIRGGFSFPTVPAGEWQLSAESGGRSLPVSAIVASGRVRRGNAITVKDQALTIQVAVAQGGTRVQGFARRGGKGVAGAMMVLVPSDLTAVGGLIRRDQSDSDGSFSLRDVVAGRYTLVAIEDGWALDWAEPRVLARYLPGGIPVTVSERSGKTLTLSSSVPVQAR